MRYRVLVEVLKHSFTWIEVESNHPLDCIEPALTSASKLPPEAFLEARALDPVIGLLGCDEIQSPLVLAVIDEAGTAHYTRPEELDALHQIEKDS
jgi:hypothetical protein